MGDMFERRLAGGLIITAILAALALMLHHPTSVHGPDDGLLLNDWGNTVVHGVMIACLFVLRIAFSTWARQLGSDHLSVRAGLMALDGGMSAFIAAALMSGFATTGLVASQLDPGAVRLQLEAFVAVNRALANLGMALTAVAMALWAIRMARLSGLARIAGALGIVIACVAVGWAIVGRGAFGLYPATVATVLFGAWALLVASQMMRANPAGEA